MDNKLDTIRHSVSHIAAAAVKQLFPGVKFAIGPTIDEGFYYDFDLPRPLTPQDLPRIEKRMTELIKQNLPFERYEVPFAKAMEMAREQPYKRELINEIQNKNETITFYKVNGFVDLCRGPHIANTKEINPKTFKLIKIAGAYWRGNEKNKMLQRIYGTAFLTEAELKKFLKQREEAEMRDHRKVGREQELIAFHPTSPGAPFWLPKGMIIFRELEKLWREIHDAAGYQEINTPIVNHKSLWEKSGHWDHYKENMFNFKIDEELYSLKPMNCPGSTYVYAGKKRSYKELPLRFSEIGRLHRNEVKGALGGLFRVRQITMDDAHIFCRPDQIPAEISGVLKLIKQFYKIFSFNPRFVLSTRPKEFMGEIKDWDKAESDLTASLKKNKVNYKVSPGDGAFYGPKVDVMIDDTLGRTWQMATIQLDFQMPKRFNLVYTDKDGTEKHAAMIHRAIFGSFERFFGILIEHYAGAFPIWLAPVQVQIIPVGSKHVKFSEKLGQQLMAEGLRVSVDDVNETVGYKIRKAEKMRVPYMLVIGDKEMKAKSLAIRDRGKKVVRKVALKKFIAEIKKKITAKK
ncbi:MAG: threonine--tRNA ligase [Patescibacteria group bacterium]